MPTNSEKIDELARLVTELAGRVATIEKDAEWSSEWVEKLRAASEEMRIRLATLEREIEELKKSREEWGRRGWAIVMALITAFIGGVIGYLLKR